MKLFSIKKMQIIFETFQRIYQNQEQQLLIKFFIDKQEIRKLIVRIESMEIIELYDFEVNCVDINNELTRFLFNRKSEKNENEKMKNLSIDRINKDGEILYNEYS